MKRFGLSCLLLVAVAGWSGCGNGGSGVDGDCALDADCDDGDACTADSCSDGACAHEPLDCDDGDGCTVDSCAAGQCEHRPLDCDDDDPCTVDSCADGQCGHQPLCDDGDACTSDTCNDGQCSHQPPDCDDGDPCTVDSCDPASGQCAHEADPACSNCDIQQDLGCGSQTDGDLAQGGVSRLELYGCWAASFTGPEAVYRFIPAADGHIQLNVDPQFDAALIALGGACDPQQCLAAVADAGGLDEMERLELDVEAGVPVYLVVESMPPSPPGAYMLSLSCDQESELICGDELDNDGDGLTDCADPDCHDVAPPCEDPERSCSDEFDNDGDGLTDCVDDSCLGQPACAADSEIDCANQVDDDADGWSDCEDDECLGDPACPACSPTAQLDCGEAVQLDFYGASSQLTSYSCTHDPYPEAELVYEIVAPGDHGLRATVTAGSAFDPAPAILALQGECAPAACVAATDFLLIGERSELTVPAQVGEVFYFVLENRGLPDGAHTLQLDCVEAPLCDDGLDNDGDGATDCQDEDCAHAAGCFCLPAQAPVGCNTILSGDISGQPSVRESYACSPLPMLFEGPEALHAFTAPASGTVRLSLVEYHGTFGLGVFDEDCDPDSDQSCLAFTNPTLGTELDFDAQQGVTYTIFYDLHRADDPGAYGIRLTCEGPEDCADGFDTDLDGDTDCWDSDCRDPQADPDTWDPACRAETICNDGVDNDADGEADCLDADCDGQPGPAGAPCEFGAESICDDGADNDGDGSTDCRDADCDGQMGSGGQCEPDGETICDDGFDNDARMGADCADPQCDGQLGPDGIPCEGGWEQTCDDGFDNDGDGQTDCQDADCHYDAACYEGDCHNGLDDDDDGLTDCEDGNCQDPNHPDGCVEQDCDDGLDDDLDGDTDCDDWDCHDDPACVETVCDDGLDDDGNGLTDCADPECHGELGPDGQLCEPLGETSCDDGFDNDGDGEVDCADADCDDGAGCLCLDAAAAACGDSLSGDWAGQDSLVDGYACMLDGAYGPERVYAFSPAQSGPVQLRAAAGQQGTLRFAVLDERCDPLDPASCLAGTQAVTEILPDTYWAAPVAFMAQSDQTYYLVVDSSQDAPDSFAADLRCPSEQLCTAAEPLQCGQQISDSFGPAVLDTWCGSSEPLPPGNRQAFYSFTPAEDGRVEFFTGPGTVPMVMLDRCNPDACFAMGIGPAVEVELQAGQTYYIGLMTEDPNLDVHLQVNCF